MYTFPTSWVIEGVGEGGVIVILLDQTNCVSLLWNMSFSVLSVGQLVTSCSPIKHLITPTPHALIHCSHLLHSYGFKFL